MPWDGQRHMRKNAWDLILLAPGIDRNTTQKHGATSKAGPETHTKRQATPRDCLPIFLGNGEKKIEIVYGEEKKIFCTGPTSVSKAEQKSFVLARQAQRTKKE